HTSHAFHSAMMEPVLASFTEVVQHIDLHEPQLPFLSNLTGTWIRPDEAVDPGYWTQHLRATVHFEAGVREIVQEPHRLLLEVGPGTTLSAFVRQHPLARNLQPALASLRRPEVGQGSEGQGLEPRTMLDSLGRLWTAGVAVDWSGYYAPERRYRVP